MNGRRPWTHPLYKRSRIFRNPNSQRLRRSSQAEIPPLLLNNLVLDARSLATPVLDSSLVVAVHVAAGEARAVPRVETLLFTPSFVSNWNESDDWGWSANPTTVADSDEDALGLVLQLH